MNVAYITKDSSKEEIYEAYIESQKRLKATVFHKKEIQDKVAEVRKEKNKKYNELRYQVLKRDQKIFRLNQHIMNLQRFAVNERSKAKKKGIQEGRDRIRVKDYSVIKMYEFLIQTEQVSNILGMKLSYCAFILWAGRYNFFTIKDFKRDIPKTLVTYHNMITYFTKKNMIVGIRNEKGLRQYALTGTGVDMFNKIDKFTKKHFNE
jgi:hypothetical protein